MLDFATRAYNRSFRRDWIVRSLLDTDFYKLLMMQFIWEMYPNERVRWKVTNRTYRVRLADEVDIEELRDQLDHCRELRLQPNEHIWLRGQKFYGREGIFREGYLNTLKTFRLPAYRLEVTEDGQIDLTFEGYWWETTLWEIFALTIINELRTRKKMSMMTRAQIDITYARAKVKLYRKLELLSDVAGLNLSDFGTRRRHSFLWQEYCVETAKEVVGVGFTGTSNVYLAMKLGLEARGTNAHELPMVFAAIARARYPNDPDKLRDAQYEVLRKWQAYYHENLLIALPDTFGTTQFLKNAPQWINNWKGFRPDSKNAYVAGEEIIDFWNNRGLTPEAVLKKLTIFSDGLDVELDGKSNGEDIIKLHHHFDGRMLVGIGWGTNLTNDFISCSPLGEDFLKSISLVCKVIAIGTTPNTEGHSTVKLSDNYEKATGTPEEIAVYRETFGSEGMKDAPVLV